MLLSEFRQVVLRTDLERNGGGKGVAPDDTCPSADRLDLPDEALRAVGGQDEAHRVRGRSRFLDLRE